MTKRSKKKHVKRGSEPPLSDDGDGISSRNGVPGSHAERFNQPTDPHRHSSREVAVDLSFFRKSAQLYGELHQRFNRGNAESFTETSISHTGRQVLQALDELAEAADPRFDSKSACPFVMLLSMLLPTLRKYLTWTKATKSVWGTNFVLSRHPSSTFNGPTYKVETDNVVWAMLAQHDILARFSLQTAHILRLIESNGDATDQESDFVAHDSKGASPVSSWSESCSSTPRERLDAAPVRTPRVDREMQAPVPQIHQISAELVHVDAECKVHLADLSESLVEVVDMIAKHLCAPTASRDAGRAQISAREFIERLVQHLLEPMGQRMLAEPSASYVDLFPRLLDQCISVIIDNFARSGGKQDELLAASFEAGVMHLRTWSLKLEIEFNTLMRSLNSSNNTDSSTDTESSNRPLTAIYPTNNRLELMTLSGFRRLETSVGLWLHASSTSGNAPDPGSGSSSRSWGVSSLAGGIRSTLVRTFSGRATFANPPV